MRPAGRQFDKPALECHVLFEWPLIYNDDEEIVLKVSKRKFPFLELSFSFLMHLSLLNLHLIGEITSSSLPIQIIG